MLLLSRAMLTRSSDILPLKTVLAFAALAFVASQADAGRVRSAGQELAVHVSTEVQANTSDMDAGAIDAERVFQNDSSAPRTVASPAANAGSDLSPLPSSEAFEAAGAGELRGKVLLRAMADLPQVGGTSDRSLSLEFWDDSATARSAVDDRAVGAADQGNARAGAHSNVMIPVPMAAWSALSVLGGFGFAAGVRKLARRVS